MVKKLFVLLLCFLSVMTVFGQDKRKSKEEEIYEISKNEDKPIHFYGKVIDQNEDPVEGAVVKCEYGYFDQSAGVLNMYIGTKRLTLVTDKDGRFEIKEKGYEPSVWVEGKDGYDAKGIPSKNYKFDKEGKYKEDNNIDNPFRSPDPSNPEIFVIRKKGEPVLLMASGGEFYLRRGENRKYALSGLSTYFGGPPRSLEEAQKKEKRIDIILHCEYKEGIYYLIVEPQGEEKGVMINENEPYVAGDGEYKGKYEVEIKDEGNSKEKVYYFVIKSGDPVLYSKLAIDVVVLNGGKEESSLWVKYNLACNPYGGKELEQIWGIDNYRDLEVQVWNSMLKEKKYPLKPDFRKLQEEAKKRATK